MTTPKTPRKPADWMRIKAALKEDQGGILFAIVGLLVFLVTWTWAGNTHFQNALPLAWAGIGLGLVCLGALQMGATGHRKLRRRIQALEILAGVKDPTRQDESPAAEASPQDPPATDHVLEEPPGPASSSMDPRGAKGA